MIITSAINTIVNVITYILSSLVSLPAFNSISNTLSPYLNALADLITTGAAFVSFFMPIQLIQTLIPIVLAIETALITLDIIKFIINIIGSLK